MRLTIDPEGVRILVVDDEDYITDLVAVGLRFVGFEVDTAADGRDALAKIVADRPDLVVLDIAMPGIDGLEVVERLRRDGVATPVVFLTARDAPAERVKGLHLGADDYITKPFSLEELLARIEAVLRRVAPGERWLRQIEIDDLTLDQDGREVRRAGRRIEMSRTEFNVLEFLMMNAGRVVSKQQILDYVWQYDFGGESTVVETYISYLRKKLDALGSPLIHTLRGVGYVIRGPNQDPA
jgi:two-component system OmpR family response regulator